MRLSLSTLSRTMLNDDRRILEDLIRANDKEGNDQYIKLSALLGSSGLFHQAGLHRPAAGDRGADADIGALPLIRSHGALEANLLDMAKLTPGAFLESFVQRKIGSDAAAGGG
ncbi:MAG: hypothetical protein ACJAWZ_004012 [Paracoccaceae bacterium]|jgi:hypothetical protein